jgi:hypothetical protein
MDVVIKILNLKSSQPSGRVTPTVNNAHATFGLCLYFVMQSLFFTFSSLLQPMKTIESLQTQMKSAGNRRPCEPATVILEKVGHLRTNNIFTGYGSAVLAWKVC